MHTAMNRRGFLRIAGGVAAIAAGAGLVPYARQNWLAPAEVVLAQDLDEYDIFMAGTDGWMSLPTTPAIAPYHPDVLAPEPFSTYIFGFRNVTNLAAEDVSKQRMKAQHNAPLFWADQYVGTPETELRVRLTNLGLQMRPDLTDAHTLHWHGFRNVIAFFDGEPTGSVAVKVSSVFTYVFRPRDPGTYMWHCHVEDVEHVHMGMTGVVFVRPQLGPKFVYNDPTTGFDREYAMFLSEVWAEAHWADAHIQLPDWSDYHADFSLLNGRVYPDTIEPNAPINAATSTHFLDVQTDDEGDLVAPDGRADLQYQPHSSLVTCNEGEKVLLRCVNLGFREASMTLAGIKMHVVGRDATPMRGRDGTDTSYETNTLLIGAGESYDAIFTAPAHSGGSGPDVYMFYNRRYTQDANLADGGYGGQRTEIRVYPAGTVGSQRYPNDHDGA